MNLEKFDSQKGSLVTHFRIHLGEKPYGVQNVENGLLEVLLQISINVIPRASQTANPRHNVTTKQKRRTWRMHLRPKLQSPLALCMARVVQGWLYFVLPPLLDTNLLSVTVTPKGSEYILFSIIPSPPIAV